MPEALECSECAVLRRKYADASLSHVDLRDQLRQAARRGKRERLTALLISESAALKERAASEAALRKHQTAAHGGGYEKAMAV